MYLERLRTVHSLELVSGETHMVPLWGHTGMQPCVNKHAMKIEGLEKQQWLCLILADNWFLITKQLMRHQTVKHSYFLSGKMMNFSTFFSEQARKPAGLFGRLVMSNIFNIGNARLNRFVHEIMLVQENDHILEIGFGTGKLIYAMADQIDQGLIEGVDFSGTMVSIAQKRTKKHIAGGKVKIHKGNFDEMLFEKDGFDKVCSVNTIYFWTEPENTAKKIVDILKPGGMFVAAFEDIAQLEQRQLDNEVFSLYSKDDVKNLLVDAGFSNGVSIKSRAFGSSVLNCAIAIK